MYRDLYADLSLLGKIAIFLRCWFQAEGVEEAIRHREYRALYRRLERDHQEVVDPGLPMLLGGFTRRIVELVKRMSVIKTVVDEVTGERAGKFLQSALKTLDPDMAEQIERAANLTEELLNDYTITLAAAEQALKDSLQQALSVHQPHLLRQLGPVWSCLIALKHLSQTPMKSFLPAGGTREPRIPLRVVREDLIQLYRELQYARKYQEPRGLDIAVEFATQRLGRSFSLYRGIWEVIDDLLETIPFLDIIRLALEEPRATVEPAKHPQEWWPIFEASWISFLEAGPSLLRHRSYRIESILHDDFSVVAPAITWVPTSLFQRSVGALRRLASGPEFRLTRVFVGTVAREEGLLRPFNRKELLAAHVSLDQQLDRMEEFIGTGENRGKIGEEVKRLSASTNDASLVRIQMTGVLSKYRPAVRTMITDAIDALDTIHRVCSMEEKTIAKGFPRISAALADTLGDASPRYALDLIVHRYGPLVETLRGLLAIERELTAGGEAESEELLDSAESGST
ncbi:MAG: hypothetical protein EA427_13655 [Spirochaetaceae bacterium]|nr:MAG: hypothetical protein EA427_13655 [Spirochaetaceae bacterium]